MKRSQSLQIVRSYHVNIAIELVSRSRDLSTWLCIIIKAVRLDHELVNYQSCFMRSDYIKVLIENWIEKYRQIVYKNWHTTMKSSVIRLPTFQIKNKYYRLIKANIDCIHKTNKIKIQLPNRLRICENTKLMAIPSERFTYIHISGYSFKIWILHIVVWIIFLRPTNTIEYIHLF